MTLYSWGDPRRFPRLPPPTLRYFDVAPDARVLAHCHWQPRPWEHPTVLGLHGLNGSSDAHYMRGLAEQADSYVGMELLDPSIDFVGLARSLGVAAERAKTVQEATDLLAQGLNGGGAMLIDVELDRAFKPL